jgi:hypothetical protein
LLALGIATNSAGVFQCFSRLIWRVPRGLNDPLHHIEAKPGGVRPLLLAWFVCHADDPLSRPIMAYPLNNDFILFFVDSETNHENMVAAIRVIDV